ncbi:hypothetical protein VKT23_010796 [Stygiomarasmius scandens]|uniref:Nephrocystin 3-like N-terminal domain-containing protein n=1 Tax=Marasmiellus scandens TaxID=2682957 RepID=A0ABR1JCQ6_9AGAR
MHGHPSSGKTTIVGGVTRKLTADDSPNKAIVINYICTRVNFQSNNMGNIIPHLAYYLAEKHQAYRKRLANYLESLSGTDSPISSISKWMPAKQFTELLVNPLGLVASSRPDTKELKPVVLIIDSLEECVSEQYPYGSSAKELMTNLLQGLCGDWGSATNLRVIVSSRPIPVIRDQLDHDKNLSFVTPLDLNEYLQTSDAETDIRTFYEDKFKEIRAENEDLSRDGNWPSNDVINSLVNSTGNSFLIAQQICHHVGRVSDAQAELDRWLQKSSTEFRSFGTQDMYTSLLDKAVEQLFNEDLDLFRKTIMTIVLLKKLTSVEDLAAILGFKASTLHKCLRGVESIMIAPVKAQYKSTAFQQVTDVIRVDDTSFFDYMRDKITAHPKVWIDPSVQNCFIAGRLLILLNDRLNEISNIAEFDESHEKKVGTLEVRGGTKHKRLNRAIFYASRFWMYHLKESDRSQDNQNFEDQDLARNQIIVIRELKKFLQRGRLLSWLTVLERYNFSDDARLSTKNVKVWLNDLASRREILTKVSSPGPAEPTKEVDTLIWHYLRFKSTPTISYGQPRESKTMSYEKYDDRDRTEAIRLANDALMFLQSEECKDQLRTAKLDVSSNMSAVADEEPVQLTFDDPVRGLKQFMTTQYNDDVRKKARDLLQALEK